jgi:hypothetical protein
MIVDRMAKPRSIIVFAIFTLVWAVMCQSCNEPIQLAAYDIFSHVAVPHRSITLEERADIVLQDPLCLAISPSGKYLAITDRATGALIVYETVTGKLVAAYHPTADLIDSVADAMSSWPFKNVIDSNTASLLRFSKAIDEKGKLYTPRELLRDVPSRLRSCVFVNDSTVMAAAELSGMYRRLDESGRSVQGSYPVTGFIEYEINNKRVRVRPYDASLVDDRRPYNPQPDALVRRTASGTFLLNCLYLPQVNYSDVRPVIEVDANWKEVRHLGAIPSVLLNKAFWDFHSEVIVTDIPGADRPLMAFSVLPQVFDVRKGTSFQLRTASDNQDYLNRIPQYIKNQSSMPADSVMAGLNFEILGMEPMGGDSLFVTLWHRIRGKDSVALLGQEYRVTGEFLRSYTIAEARDQGFLPKATYFLPLQSVAVVKSNDSVWQLSLMRSPR